MFDLHEFFSESTFVGDEELIKINVDVIVENASISEKLPDGSKVYDEQTLEDWYDFASSVENIVDNLTDTVNISLSKTRGSLSEYIDFYVYDLNGNKKNYLIDLRLSDHKQTTNGRTNRKNKASKIDSNFILKSIIVNDRQYNSYSDAIFAVKKLILDEMK